MTVRVNIIDSPRGWLVCVYDHGAGAILGPMSREDAFRQVGPALGGAVLGESCPEVD